MGLHAELQEQQDPRIGQELIRVRHEDGHIEELRLHDYDRLYALPGVYEQIVQERLQCASPARIAAMLADAVDALSNSASELIADGWSRATVRVIDIAAGNGVSGEALAAQQLSCVLGTDIVPTAREAAMRDRPGLYRQYLTLDLLGLTAEQTAQLRAVRANVLTCVAPVGAEPSQLPVPALLSAARLLTDDALVAYMHDPSGGADVVTAELWGEQLHVEAQQIARERYVHRRTVNGAPVEMVGMVWRLRRQAQSRPGPRAPPARRRTWRTACRRA